MHGKRQIKTMVMGEENTDKQSDTEVLLALLTMYLSE